MNNEFLRQCKRISKTCRGNLQEKEGEIRDLLIRLLGNFPKEMARELGDYFLTGQDWERDIQKGADLVDLHNEELDMENSLLDREEWAFIKELVNSFAEDLDLDWITYCMQCLLDRNLI